MTGELEMAVHVNFRVLLWDWFSRQKYWVVI